MTLNITEEKRQSRRDELSGLGFHPWQIEALSPFIDMRPEFGPMPFTIRDLFEIHLLDTIRTMQYQGINLNRAVAVDVGLREVLITQSKASANLAAMTYIWAKANE